MQIANPIYNMQMEDDYISELLMKDEIIAGKEKTIAEKEKTLAESKKTIEKQQKRIAELEKLLENN